MRTRKIPRGARHLRTYAEFLSYLTDFVLGLYPFLWVVGRPGVAKTESIRAATRGRKVLFFKGGQLTPPRFYIDCYHRRGDPIILDDAENLLDNKVGARLVAALGDTSRAKQMSYATTGSVLGDVPQSYFTTSPLCIIANRATSHEAIWSRAVILFFDPTNLEVHRAVAEWFWDQEIHNWFGQHLHRLPALDVRWYVIAAQDKQANRDWRQLITKSHVLDRVASIVQDLECDPAYPQREDKARRFSELMGNDSKKSRSTYHRKLAELREEQRLIPETVPPIQLRRTRPPSVPSVLELESMAAPLPEPPEEEPRPLDVPSREAFAEPVRGSAVPPAPPRRPVLDDTVGWEGPAAPEDDDA